MTGKTLRKGALMNSGTPSPNPWHLSLPRQNVCSKLKALERRITAAQGCDPSADSRPGMARGGFTAAPNSNPDPPDLSLLRAKNGLDNGVHFTPTVSSHPSKLVTRRSINAQLRNSG